jgi:predicted helicase
MTIQQYITKINTLYKTGNAREHSYRGDLQNLIMAILPDVLVTNEPARVDCGAPDYVLTRKDVPIGYIEAKDIGIDLASKNLKEQFDRYKAGLTNLIFTDYLDFHFYKDGEFVTKIAIAASPDPSKGGEIVPIPENFEQFTNLIINFAQTISQTIKSPTKLAQMMAGKAKLMADVIEKSLNIDDENNVRSSIKAQMLSFQQMLIHDIDNKAFADIYAQTIAYGMFAARYHDPTLPTFSREEAATLIPKSNPFLRKLFQDIAGYDLDNRLVWIVDELVSIFLASDVALIMKNFGKSTKQEDPVVHFYETFLGEYNPALRKARGVWYTPQPVVNFIVRAVDDILKTEFNLPQGLADSSKIRIKKNIQTSNGFKPIGEVEVHKVQILDPATGTGTFLAEVVKHIHKKFEGQQGIWSKYVTNDLIPRLNGFELLMASYAMAHLKMDMLLTETGYSPPTPKGGATEQRIKIFLTNSLEEAHPDSQTLFSSWLSDEADQANAIKRDAPVMVVMGNPPYSVSSSNKSPWIESLTADYKKDLNERNIQPLSDDYIKFTRFGQHFIDKNGSGILAYISNNSFIDGIIHRQMRKHLLESFDKIYILDLHGNSRKKEVSPDGSIDQNVFDIMAGVSINIFIKTNKKKQNELGEIFQFDFYGKRENKYLKLEESIYKINWEKLNFEDPYYFFVPKDFGQQNEYEQGFKLDNLFKKNNSGIKSHRDNLVYDVSKEDLLKRIHYFVNPENSDANVSMELGIKSNRDWDLNLKRQKIIDIISHEDFIKEVEYKPFNKYFCYYNIEAHDYHRIDLLKNMFNDNLLLMSSRKDESETFRNIFITKYLGDIHSVSDQTYCFPLYLYPETTTQQSLLDEVVRTPNLNMEIVNQFSEKLGIPFVAEKPETRNSQPATVFAPIDLLDYIYAVLHSPSYRDKYKEFLKIDFPRVPFPTNLQGFWNLVGLGSQLRQIHLLESEVVEQFITQYPEDGDNIVTKPVYKDGNVYINATQYFANVPQLAWEFYIGGYQPAQKWLKDRKERELSHEDIFHYQKIIVALNETDRLMKEIDKLII